MKEKVSILNFKASVILKKNFNSLSFLKIFFRTVKTNRKMYHNAEDRNGIVTTFHN